MRYYSTRNPNHTATLREAVFRGLAPDGGLYLPEKFEPLPAAFFADIERLPFGEINFRAARALCGNNVPEATLRKITDEAVNFPVPAKEIEPGIYSLELFHGPTLAFKDVGARFTARLLGHFAETENQSIKVVVATSGDTGGAVAAGFFGVPGIEVFILYPEGRVSPIQEKQLTTWGGNITAIEVKGAFDDCQALAKRMLNDSELTAKQRITSANSINIARLIPQSFYYFQLYAQLKSLGKPLTVCVPSGNFGNLTAGLMAKKLGLPVSKFLAATNANDVVPEFMRTGTYRPRPSVATVSNAMDVGAPSNFERMREMFGSSPEDFVPFLGAAGVSDASTKAAMDEVYRRTGYLLDPHGAVGYEVLKAYLGKDSSSVGVVLETAHPAKFSEVTEAAVGKLPEMPERLRAFAEKEKKAVKIDNDYDAARAVVAEN